MFQKGICAASERQSAVKMHFQLLRMERLLIQYVCDQARRELMEAVFLYLTKVEEDPA